MVNYLLHTLVNNIFLFLNINVYDDLLCFSVDLTIAYKDENITIRARFCFQALYYTLSLML